MRASLCCLAIAFALPARSWNIPAHRICAAITYDQLTPRARAHVDEILRHHPDYATLLTRDSPPDPATRARAAFLAAAAWPDSIRDDQRFYDDTKAAIPPTPLLPGFPDMKRHSNWHYIDIPYSPEGVPAKVEPPPTSLSELQRILHEFEQRRPDAELAYDLPWLLHLEEDVHEPMHDIERYLKSQPKGDGSGNVVYVTPLGVPSGDRLFTTLHAVWDQSAGTDTSDAYTTRMAGEISAQYLAAFGPGKRSPRDPGKWVMEGYKIAKVSGYSFGLITGTREAPLTLPSGYESQMRAIARKQIALAGFRLAEVLNEIFR